MGTDEEPLDESEGWWAKEPMELRHYKTRRGAENYARRIPALWYISDTTESTTVTPKEKRDMGVWVAVQVRRFHWLSGFYNIDVDWTIIGTIDSRT
jgi:hypothetical protein